MCVNLTFQLPDYTEFGGTVVLVVYAKTCQENFASERILKFRFVELNVIKEV